MSKKKATMTLKDFHGGSIPSDLPLPSAPGVTVRPSDRPGFDRQPAWGNPMGRPEQRLRPGSAGTTRNFDDKTPFLTHNTRIGRNFDEDERTPLDGSSAPRRTVSDDSIRVLPVRVEPNLGRVSSRPVSTPVPSQLSGGTTSSYAARFTEVNPQNVSGGIHLGLNNPNMGGHSGPHPNAWGPRKEVVSVVESAPTSWSAPDAAIKLAHASALEKVSSGRWHTKQATPHQVDVEVIRHPETENGAYTKGNFIYNTSTYTVMDVPGGQGFHDVTLTRHAERTLVVDDLTHVGSKELPVYAKERNPQFFVDRTQPPRTPELQSPVASEQLERPKLKLLPRSKPSESVEPFVGYKQGYQQPSDPSLLENGSETHGNAFPTKPGLAGPESGNRAVERPKLSLKPRSQPLEQSEVQIERGRNTLFGGARPRELVLKERGIDDVAVSNQTLVQSPNRVKPDVQWTETSPVRASPRYNNERSENNNNNNAPLDHRIIGKNIDRRDHRANVEKQDAQKNWRTENRRSSKELGKLQQKPPLERPPSPETWRKPVEQPPLPSQGGPRYGKVASAVELAQAFSSPVSDPKIADRFSGQRGGRGEVPFSRLTGPLPRAQINSY